MGASMRRGATYLPPTSTASTPGGGLHRSPSAPAHTTRPSRTTTAALRTGGALGLTSVPPTSAIGGGDAPCGRPNAVLTAIFHPAGVRRKIRSEIPSVVAPPCVTR